MRRIVRDELRPGTRGALPREGGREPAESRGGAEPGRRRRATVRGSGTAGGRHTRQLLLRTAEHLFAELGMDAVSLRQISSAAGLRMSGAVAYHFGDKGGLIQAIIADRSIGLDLRREAMLAELEKEGRMDDLRALVEAEIRPAIESIGESGYYFRFIAQLERHPQMLSGALRSGAFRSARRARDLQDDVVRSLLPAVIVEHRKELAVQLIIGALAELESNAERGPTEAAARNLIDCLVALYSTQPSAETVDAAELEATRT